MKVIVRENGDPGSVVTQTRMNARNGSKTLADVLSEIDSIDLCVITLDWTGDTFTSAVTIEAWKWNPAWRERIKMDPWVINLKDLFEDDNADLELFLDIREAMKDLFRDMERQKGII